MAKKIIVIGTSLPHDEVEFVALHAQDSLLDYDISVFNPDIASFYGGYGGYGHDSYLGKPSLNDTNSFELREKLSHWHQEILDAVRAGKTVFILLNELQDVYIATGEKSFSGTGRNRQVTRHVTGASNYELVPGGINVINSKGTSMKLHGKDNILAAYWTDLESVSEYRVFVSGEGIRPLVITKTGNKTVGAYIKYKDAPGTLVLLPYINHRLEGFIRETRGRKEYWTDRAVQVGKQFISAIVGIDSILKEGQEFTPAPNWVAEEKYVLEKEQNIGNELLTLETKIGAIQKQKEQLQQTLARETELKRLLYDKGKPLEAAILKSLKLIGFEASQYHSSDSEFDVVFESAEGRLIGEAEGKDNKPINIDKLRQLEMNIHEDYDRDEVKEIAKGVLFGNAYRLLPPENRDEFFTEKCITATKRNNTALIRTTDLFRVSKYLSSTEDIEFAKNCRKAILESVGVVVFPDIPETETHVSNNVVTDKRD
jgi:hypothetical protein